MKIIAFNYGKPRLWLPPKILLIMRLIIIIMTTCLLQVSASSFGQQVTLSEKNVPLEKIFQLIRQQTGYDFLYDGKEIQSAKPVDVNFKNLDLRGALKKCLEDQGFEFEIGDKSIVVTKKTSSLIDRIAGVLTNIDVRGRVTDESGNALPGAVIRVKGANRSTSTNDKGEFFLGNVDEKAVLIIAYVGYETREVSAAKDLGTVSLKLANNALEEVNVTVSTGYQNLPKERATGSFAFVDNKLLNRSVSTNVLDRLDGVTSGIIFNKVANKVGFSQEGGDPGISIRGRSTLFANTEPLIILDNFPYEGDPVNINPNDIESVTVLKDAAAASIWGVRAGNGVIVITSKRGRSNQKPVISFNTILTVVDKPNLFAIPQLSSKEYVDLEKFWFNKGKYDFFLSYFPYTLQSPVVDILDNEKKGLINHSQAASQLDALSSTDIRNDYSRYFFRKALNQQYSLAIKGGGQNDQYYISGGFNRNLNNQISNDYNRFTLNAHNSYKLLQQRLELSSDIFIVKSLSRANGNQYTPWYPYEKIIDEKGNALSVIRDYRQESKNKLSNSNFLDWNYYPYTERLNNNNKTDLSDYRLNIGANYKIIPEILNIAINYQYQQGNIDQNTLQDQNSYFTRFLINQYTQVDPAAGNVTNPIPLGGILTNITTNYKSNTGRAQLNYNQTFSVKHQINAIGGLEVKDYNSFNRTIRLFGYNQDNATNIPVDFFTNFKKQIVGSDRIPNVYGQNGITDHFISYYVNAAYTYNQKYTLSTSARKDKSNLFGVDANQKGIPLYSLGASWDISKENFYNITMIPYLRLRVTNGYNGNLAKNLSAYTTARTDGINIYNAPQQIIVNPPNPNLSWEKVHIINLALDFGSKNNRLNGGIEVFYKKGLDLIGNSPVAPQAGNVQFTGNTADMLTKGMDLSLNSVNLKGALGWTTNFLFSYVRDKVTSYKLQTGIANNYIQSNYMNPIVGRPYSAVFAYPWAGLDNKGNPQGMLDGKLSQDYGAILNSTNLSNLVYVGSASPGIFGSLRNNFTYRSIELSFNITYKMGYYFRKGSYNSSNPGYQQADYSKRWQNPGDEKITNVPALLYPQDNQRDVFYNGSEILVEKGDHIRLQDIQVAYTIHKSNKNFPFHNLRIYGYVNNLGILWRANKSGLDPDYVGGGNYLMPNPKSYSMGLTADF